MEAETLVTLPDGTEAVTATVLSLRPGDILVVTYADRLSSEMVSRLGSALRERIPESVKIMVMDGGPQLAVIRTEPTP